jgi:hypothetical protein
MLQVPLMGELKDAEKQYFTGSCQFLKTAVA